MLFGTKTNVFQQHCLYCSCWSVLNSQLRAEKSRLTALKARLSQSVETQNSGCSCKLIFTEVATWKPTVVS